MVKSGKYRKVSTISGEAPVIVAAQFSGTVADASLLMKWDKACARFDGETVGSDVRLFVDTPVGQIAARAGDWLVRNERDEVSVCLDAVFHSLYEEVTPSADISGGLDRRAHEPIMSKLREEKP